MSWGTGIKIAISYVMIFCLLWVLLFFALQTVYPLKFSGFVSKYSAQYDVDTRLVYSIMKAESNFSVTAVSGKDAVGLMQLMPATALWIAQQLDVQGYSLYDPETNIMFSCWYLSYLTDKFSSLETAVAAYNAGEGVVKQWLKNPGLSRDGEQLYKIPYNETNRYVKKVMNAYNIYNCLY